MDNWGVSGNRRSVKEKRFYLLCAHTYELDRCLERDSLFLVGLRCLLFLATLTHAPFLFVVFDEKWFLGQHGQQIYERKERNKKGRRKRITYHPSC